MLAGGIPLFTEKCLEGITANKEKCAAYANNSLALSTILAILFDYPVANQIAKEAWKKDLSIKEVAVQNGLLSQVQADMLLAPANLIDINVFETMIEKYKHEKS